MIANFVPASEVDVVLSLMFLGLVYSVVAHLFRDRSED